MTFSVTVSFLLVFAVLTMNSVLTSAEAAVLDPTSLEYQQEEFDFAGVELNAEDLTFEKDFGKTKSLFSEFISTG